MARGWLLRSAPKESAWDTTPQGGRPATGLGEGLRSAGGHGSPAPMMCCTLRRAALTNQQGQEFGADQWLWGGAVTGRVGAGGGGYDYRTGREGSLRGWQRPALSCDPAPWSCKVLLAGERLGGAHRGPGACPPALVLETVWESTLSQNLPKKEARASVLCKHVATSFNGREDGARGSRSPPHQHSVSTV